MEKRFWLGIGILVALLVVGLGVSGAMQRLHRPGAEAFYKASQLALEGDLAQARDLAEGGKRRWEESRLFSACVADHGPMDQVEDLLAEMTVFAQAEDTVHFAACCRELAEAVGAIYEAHELSVGSLW